MLTFIRLHKAKSAPKFHFWAESLLQNWKMRFFKIKSQSFFNHKLPLQCDRKKVLFGLDFSDAKIIIAWLKGARSHSIVIEVSTLLCCKLYFESSECKFADISLVFDLKTNGWQESDEIYFDKKYLNYIQQETE